jgi:ABC-2 type transport system permease protein
MLFSLIKKQLLVLSRNKQNFTLLLLMPIVLITIIKFAIGDMLTQGVPEIEGKVAIAEHSNEEEDVARFIEEIERLPISEEEKKEISDSLAEFRPIHILKEYVFGNEEIQKMITLDEIAPEEIEDAMDEEKYAVVIEVPANFSYEVIKSSINKNGELPSLTLYTNRSEELISQAINDILLLYENELKTNMVLGKYGASDLYVSEEDMKVAINTVSEMEVVTGTLYYAIGMSVMFVLYIASTMSTYAYEEKRLFVFDRIVLANVSKWTYFGATIITSTILAFTQLMILYGFAFLVFKVTWPSILQFLLVSITLSLAIGCLSALLVALNFRNNTLTASNVFENAIVSIMAFVGGSFFPVGNFSSFFKFLGNITPNGAGMTAYLTTAQGYGLSEISSYLFYLVTFSLLILLVALVLFPKRGHEA